MNGTAKADETIYRRFSGSRDELADIMLPLCRGMFANFDDQYLLRRLPTVVDPRLWLAVQCDTVLGFKFGYRREPDLFYSWLGGVALAARRRGIASELMRRQHAELATDGYLYVETRTRSANNAMIVLNLKHGFHIIGFETDPKDLCIVWQRKTLEERVQ